MKPEEIEVLRTFYLKLGCENVLSLLSHPLSVSALNKDENPLGISGVEPEIWELHCKTIASLFKNLVDLAKSTPDDLISDKVKKRAANINKNCADIIATMNLYCPPVELQ